MGFLVPAFLAGLAAVIVPIVLHLRHRDRDTPHRFPSLMFLERLPIRTAQRRRITDWPLLLLRALTIVLLVLAFARPLWSRTRATSASPKDRTVIVLLDRSMSMGHRGVWPAAVDSVRRTISALAQGDRVALILFDDESAIIQPLTSDRSLALAALSKALPGSAGTRYSVGLRAARQLVADARTGASPVDVVLVSDLQRTGMTGLAGLDLPASVRLHVMNVSPSTRANANVSVTDARQLVSNGRQMLSVSGRVTSRGVSTARRMTVMLRLNGRPSGTRVVSVAGDGETKIAFDPVARPSGLVRGELTIDPDSLTADDTARFALTTDDVVHLLLVTPDDADRDETLFMERALAVGSAPAVRIERVRPNAIDETRLADASMVMLWDVAAPSGSAGASLAAWTQRGGGLVVVAGRRMAQRTTQSVLMPARVNGSVDRSDERGSLGDVRLDHPLLAPFRETPSALTAPRFVRHARLDPSPTAGIVARFDDGSAAIVEQREGRGRVVMVAIPLDARSGDFPLQPAYVPLIWRLVLYSTGRDATPLARQVGESWAIPPSAREPVVSIPDGSIVRPSRDMRGASLPLREAGIYVLHDGGVHSAPLGELAVNPPTAESNLTPVSIGELLAGVSHGDVETASETRPPEPAELEQRQGIWRILIAALGVLLLLEMLMASRGWRGVANPLTTLPPSGTGS